MEDVPSQAAAWNLSAVRVRLIEPGERVRWEALMRAHHCLGLGAVGSQIVQPDHRDFGAE